MTVSEEGERKSSTARDAAAVAKATVSKVRTYLGRLIWLVCVLAALALAIGALMVALKANQDNGVVKGVLDLADTADLGVFSRTNGIKEFSPPDADIKNALFNWGIGALVWLVAGRILVWVVRPRS